MDTSDPRAAAPPDLSEELVVECLERLGKDGPRALDAMCAEHPEHAASLRRRIEGLRGLGLLGVGRIGPYELRRVLGRGGMGVVYLARDERLDRVVALKVVPETLLHRPRLLTRFQREMRSAAQLRHPSILPVFEVGEDRGLPYFTMEYVDGRTVADVLLSLRDTEAPTPADLATAAFRPHEALDEEPARLPDAGPVPSPERWPSTYEGCAARIALDVARALDHAHDHGILHRDVKPSNILLRDDGRALLFDFGLARLITDDSLTTTGDFTGTPYYVAPELLSDERASGDPRTDVYSLGVTLYELLTRRRPFEGATTDQIFRRILAGEPTEPRRLDPRLSRDLQAVCLTAMAREPQRRYTSAAALAEDLRRFLAGEAVAARTETARELWTRRARRHPGTTASLALALLLLLATVAVLWHSNRAIRLEEQQTRAQREVALAEATRASEAADLARDEARRAALATERARHEAELAHREEAKSRILNTLLMDMLAAPAPARDGAEVTVREVLDRTASRLAEKLAELPDVEVAARNAIGNTYIMLGRYDQAEEQYARALELCRTRGDEIDPSGRPRAQHNLAVVRLRQGDADAGLELLTASLARQRELADPDPDLFTATLSNLGDAHIQRGEYDDARRYLEQSLARRREQYGDEHRSIVEGEFNLAFLNDRLGVPDAPARYEEVLEEAASFLLPDDPLFAVGLRNASAGWYRRGERERAVTTLGRALELALGSFGGESRTVAVMRSSLGLWLYSEDDADDVDLERAERELAAAVAALRRLDPRGSEELAAALAQLGECRLIRDRADAAIAPLAEALGLRRALHSPTDGRVTRTLGLLARALGRNSRWDELVGLLLQAEGEYLALGAAGEDAARKCRKTLIDELRDGGEEERVATLPAPAAREP